MPTARSVKEECNGQSESIIRLIFTGSASATLLSRWTYDQGVSGQIDHISLPLPTASFRVTQGQPIVYAMALELDSYSSARGAVAVTVTDFARLENLPYIPMCVTLDP